MSNSQQPPPQPDQKFPKLNMADLGAPFKDPVPPMLKKDPSQPKTKEPFKSSLPNISQEDFEQPPEEGMISDLGREYREQHRMRFYFPGNADE